MSYQMMTRKKILLLILILEINCILSVYGNKPFDASSSSDVTYYKPKRGNKSKQDMPLKDHAIDGQIDFELQNGSVKNTRKQSIFSSLLSSTSEFGNDGFKISTKPNLSNRNEKGESLPDQSQSVDLKDPSRKNGIFRSESERRVVELWNTKPRTVHRGKHGYFEYGPPSNDASIGSRMKHQQALRESAKVDTENTNSITIEKNETQSLKDNNTTKEVLKKDLSNQSKTYSKRLQRAVPKIYSNRMDTPDSIRVSMRKGNHVDKPYSLYGNPLSTKIPSNLNYKLRRRIGKGRLTFDFGSTFIPSYDQISSNETLKQLTFEKKKEARNIDSSRLIHYRPQSLLHYEIENDLVTPPSNPNAARHRNLFRERTPDFAEQTDFSQEHSSDIRMMVDPSAFFRLLPPLILTISSCLSAFSANLRLLPPLVISKRFLNSMGNLIGDWYTGRYFRKTYTRLERIYIHYYETPASLRALARVASQWMIYLLLSHFIGTYLVGVEKLSCRTGCGPSTDGSCPSGVANSCGLLWIGSIVGTGHAFAEATARWGGPLRLQVTEWHRRQEVFGSKWSKRGNFFHKLTFFRPRQILKWIQNPEQWVHLITSPAHPERRPFVPKPWLFPVTWIPLRLLQMIAIAKVVATNPQEYVWVFPYEMNENSKDTSQIIIDKLMSKYLLQLALCDEWYRVFIRERRVGLGIAVGIVYYFAMLSMLVSSAMINGKATILMLPSLLGIIVTIWMNVVIWWNRFTASRGQKQRRDTEERNNPFDPFIIS